MHFSRVKYLAIDLDGTLFNARSKLTSRSLAAIEQCVERGLYVGLCTGRSVMTCRTLADSLPLNAPHIIQGGALIVEPDTWEPVFYANLPPEAARPVVELIRKLDLPPVLYEPMPEGYRFYYDRSAPIPDAMQRYLDFNKTRQRELSDVREMLTGPTALVATVGRREVLRTLDAELRRLPVQGHIINEHNRSHPDYGELYVLPEGANKGAALRRVCDRLGITTDNVMAFADNLNDRELIEAAGIGVAVGNAVDEIREAADLVVGPNDEDGVAEAIETYVLGR